MDNTKIKLKIADTIIALESKFPLEEFTAEEKNNQLPQRFNNFFTKDKKNADIFIRVEIVNQLPRPRNVPVLFVTRNHGDKTESWRLLKKENIYIYTSLQQDKKQVMLVNGTFDRVTAYLLLKKDKGYVWKFTDIIYDFLQVLLINYFAQRNSAIFVHAMGIRDIDGKGLLFGGKSGNGKSTSARLWYKHSKAMVLNDDRVIVRRLNRKFLIYGSPWHGDFGDYLTSRVESALLSRIFFIYHAAKNKAQQFTAQKAFLRLYPVIFPTFWDKGSLENIVSFCQDLVKSIPCYNFGFVNDKKVISFVRKI
jgi:hypothetical protein